MAGQLCGGSRVHDQNGAALFHIVFVSVGVHPGNPILKPGEPWRSPRSGEFPLAIITASYSLKSSGVTISFASITVSIVCPCSSRNLSRNGLFRPGAKDHRREARFS